MHLFLSAVRPLSRDFCVPTVKAPGPKDDQACPIPAIPVAPQKRGESGTPPLCRLIFLTEERLPWQEKRGRTPACGKFFLSQGRQSELCPSFVCENQPLSGMWKVGTRLGFDNGCAGAASSGDPQHDMVPHTVPSGVARSGAVSAPDGNVAILSVASIQQKGASYVHKVF